MGGFCGSGEKDILGGTERALYILGGRVSQFNQSRCGWILCNRTSIALLAKKPGNKLVPRAGRESFCCVGLDVI